MMPFERYDENGVTIVHHPLNTSGAAYVHMRRAVRLS